MTSRGLFALDTLVSVTAKSNNEKVGTVVATYAAQASCPASCVFINGGGCYAESGRVGMLITTNLNRSAEAHQASAMDVAVAEALEIDLLEVVDGRPMRLHVVGDCPDDACAVVVSAAAERYMDRGGGPVWTYTHAWRVVARSSWGRVSVLASCETPADTVAARERGYAPALVVDKFEDRKLYAVQGRSRTSAGSDLDNFIKSGQPTAELIAASEQHVRLLPCPAQTTDGVQCTSCRLCMNDQRILEHGSVIGFELHGPPDIVKRARKALEDPTDPRRRLSSRDVLAAFIDREGRWPSYAELAAEAGILEWSARDMIDRVRRELAGEPPRRKNIQGRHRRAG